MGIIRTGIELVSTRVMGGLIPVMTGVGGLCLLTNMVVPAKAGTHNPWREW